MQAGALNQGHVKHGVRYERQFPPSIERLLHQAGVDVRNAVSKPVVAPGCTVVQLIRMQHMALPRQAAAKRTPIAKRLNTRRGDADPIRVVAVRRERLARQPSLQPLDAAQLRLGPDVHGRSAPGLAQPFKTIALTLSHAWLHDGQTTESAMEQQGAPLAGLGAMLLTCAALMGSPGPSTLSVTAAGAAFGLRRSLAYALGLILGTTAVLLVVATGTFAVLLSIPRLASWLTVASAVYIVYLATQIARAPPLQNVTVAAPSFTGGLFLAAANPKAYMAIAAVFAGSNLEGLSPMAEALVKTVVLTVMIVLIHLVWLLIGTWLARMLRNPLASRVVNLVLAMSLLVTSVLAVLP